MDLLDLFGMVVFMVIGLVWFIWYLRAADDQEIELPKGLPREILVLQANSWYYLDQENGCYRSYSSGASLSWFVFWWNYFQPEERAVFKRDHPELVKQMEDDAPSIDLAGVEVYDTFYVDEADGDHLGLGCVGNDDPDITDLDEVEYRMDLLDASPDDEAQDDPLVGSEDYLYRYSRGTDNRGRPVTIMTPKAPFGDEDHQHGVSGKSSRPSDSGNSGEGDGGRGSGE